MQNSDSITNLSGGATQTLRLIFAVHAILTLAAGVVLIVAPAMIPRVVGLTLEPDAYLICYLLAAAELSIAALSWGARKILDAKALRIVLTALIVFHAASAILESYAFMVKAANAAVWANVVLRAAVIILFAYYGFYRMSLWKK